MNMEHMKLLEEVAHSDLATLREKEKTYKGSWKRRGGIGAFMMLARKWDRLEGILSNPTCMEDGTPHFDKYDIFQAIIEQDLSGADGTVLAEIRDLRRYLLLVEAEMLSRDTYEHYGVSPLAKSFKEWAKGPPPPYRYSSTTGSTEPVKADLPTEVAIEQPGPAKEPELSAEPYKPKSFNEIQNEIGVWARKNFGDNVSKYEGRPHFGHPLGELCSFLGMVEELGEIAAVLLKMIQGRYKGTKVDAAVAIMDGLADLNVFECDFACRVGIGIEDALNEVWDAVKKRSQKTWLEDKAKEDGPKAGNDGPGRTTCAMCLKPVVPPAIHCPECHSKLLQECRQFGDSPAVRGRMVPIVHEDQPVQYKDLGEENAREVPVSNSAADLLTGLTADGHAPSNLPKVEVTDNQEILQRKKPRAHKVRYHCHNCKTPLADRIPPVCPGCGADLYGVPDAVDSHPNEVRGPYGT